MLKLFFSLSLFFVSSILCAQNNINIDTNRFKYVERNLPTKPFQPMFLYYEKAVSMPTSISKYISEDELIDHIFIEGQRFTDEHQDSDLEVMMEMGPLTITSSEIKERVIESKNKKGEVTGREYYYWVEVKYTYTSTGFVKQGDVKRTYNLSSSSGGRYASSEYGTRKAATDFWNNNKEMLREKFIVDSAIESAQKLSRQLSIEIGFALVDRLGYIKTMNEKKHPENDALRAKSDELTALLKSLDGTNPLDFNDFTDIIEYFENIPKRYTDPRLKADKKIRYIAYYNLARIYMYMDQPEKSKIYGQLLFENDHDKKDGEKLNKESDKLIERFASSDIKTTQFDPDNYFGDVVEEEN